MTLCRLAALFSATRIAAAESSPFSIFWKLGESSWEPPPYDVSGFGFVENGTWILDVFSGQPAWPDMFGFDAGTEDGRCCGGPNCWPPAAEFPCTDYRWTNATCGAAARDSLGTPAPAAVKANRTDMGPTCCNPGGCVPQEANISAIVALTKRLVAESVPAGFSGNCVLDQEGYNSIASDVAFGDCDWPHAWSNVYRNYSLALVRARQPSLPEAEVAATAQREWRQATAALMVASLEAAKAVRPSCKWGYYGAETTCSILKPCSPSPVPGADPLCGYDHPTEGPKFRKQALDLLPVVAASDVLFPSIYLTDVFPRSHGVPLGLSGLACYLDLQNGSTSLSPPCVNDTLETQRGGIRSVVGQAMRAAAVVVNSTKPSVIPFMWEFCGICDADDDNCPPCCECHVSCCCHIRTLCVTQRLRPQT